MDDLVLQDVKVCDICADTGREDLLASCSRCSDGAEHTYCMREMMDKFPSGDWLCEECQFGVQIKGRNEETLDIEASTKMISFGQANSGGNSRNKKSLAKVSNDENRFINGPTANILGTRQTEDVEVYQGGNSRNKKSLASVSNDENRVINGPTANILGKRQIEDVEVSQGGNSHNKKSLASVSNDENRVINGATEYILGKTQTEDFEVSQGGNNRNKKSLASVSNDENRVINGPTENILGKRQTEDVEVSQGSLSFPFNKSSALQGDKGIYGGSIGCPTLETRNPELTNLSFGGKTMEKVSNNENRVINSPTANILRKRQTGDVEVSQGSMSFPFNGSSALQGDKGISGGSIGCPTFDTRNPELTNLSFGGKTMSKVSNDENKVINGPSANILEKRQTEDVEVSQGSVSFPFKKSFALQGDKGISGGSIGCPAFETRNPELTNLSFGGKTMVNVSNDENKFINGPTANILGTRQTEDVEVYQGGNSRNKKSLASVSNDENRVINGPTANILGKRQIEDVEVSQGGNSRNKKSIASVSNDENRVINGATANILGKTQAEDFKVSQGGNSRNKKSLASVSNEENRVINGPIANILGKRQTKDVEVSQGSMSFPFNGSSALQGDKGISGGSIGCPTFDTRNPELTNLSFGGKTVAKVSNDENRVINGPSANILEKRQTEDVEVSQGSMSLPFNRSSALQGDKGISGGSIGCSAFETRNLELTNLSFVGKTMAYGHMELKGPDESKRIPVNYIPDLNSTPLEQDSTSFAGERLFFPIVPIAEKEVESKSSESKALNLELSLKLEAEEAAATKGGKDELSLSLSLPFPDAHHTF